MNVRELVRGVLESKQGSKRFVACSGALGNAAMAKDRVLAKEATQVMFQQIVEPWSDSFDPPLVDRYVRFMSEVVLARRSPIAAKLAELGFSRPEQLRERYQRVCKKGRIGLPVGIDDRDIKKAIVISRVTLGADVSVSSVFLNAAHHTFRLADIEFVGPKKNAFLLANGHAVGRRLVSYSRSGLLAHRLRAWLRLRQALEESVNGLEPGQWFVIDPDSRFTQLGLLPVTDDECYGFFGSRDRSRDVDGPLASLAAEAWQVGCYDPSLFEPSVVVQHAGRAKGLYLCAGRAKLIAALSLGVGGRQSKGLGSDFEKALLALLRRLDFQIVLDYGAGKEERLAVEGLVASFPGSVAHLATVRDPRAREADLVTIRGTLGALAGWLHAADVFIGYDSAAVHVAATRQKPIIEVFAGAPTELFRKRWTPSGSDSVRVIPADGQGDGPRVLARIEQELVRIREEQGLRE